MKSLITEREVLEAVKKGNKTITVTKNTLVSPLAKDTAKQHGVIFTETSTTMPEFKSEGNFSIRRIVIGNDHSAVAVKNLIKDYLLSIGLEVFDTGAIDNTPCDYPDIAAQTVRVFFEKKASFAFLIDAVGNASAMTANKFKGIRAAVCFNEFSARSAREHNNANVLALGAKALGDETIISIVKAWLTTAYAGGRHQKRLDKLTIIEAEKLK